METDEPQETEDLEIERGGERPVYVARTLSDAQKLEEAFKAAQVAYDVEPGTYQGGVIFRSARVGAFFYVPPELRERALDVMLENGFRPLKT